MLLIGIALLIAAAVMLYIALSQPKVYVSENAQSYTYGSVKETTEKAKTDTSEIQVEFPLDINTATVEELMQIEGLGEKRAYAIVEYREYLGGYTSVEQIKNIEGIGDELYAQVQPYLSV